MRRLLLFAIPIAIAAMVAVLIVRRSPDGDTDLTNSFTPPPPPPPAVTNTNEIPIQNDSRTEVMKVSRLFSERYSSTSSAAPASHLTAAFPFASESLKKIFQRTIDRPPPSTGSTITTSRALAFSVQYIDESSGRASVVVSLQRAEQIGNSNPTTYTQDLALLLLQEEGSWKVNFAGFNPR